MYRKKLQSGEYTIFNGRYIYTTLGVFIVNPTAKILEENGYEYFTPKPHANLDPDQAELDKAIKKMLSAKAEELTDEEALEVAAIYPTWADQIGKQVAAGVRLWYNGHLYRVVQAHFPQADWTPDTTPALYTEVSVVEWPEWVQPTGAQDAYNTGDKVTFEGAHYVSLIDGNIWSPTAYLAGWERQD